MFQSIQSWISNINQRYPTRIYPMIFACILLLGSAVMLILATTQFESKSSSDALDEMSEVLIKFDRIQLDQDLLLRRRMLHHTQHSGIDQRRAKWQQDLQALLMRHSPFYQNRSICADYWLITFNFLDIIFDTANRLPNWCIVIVMEGEDYIGAAPPNIFRLTGQIQQELAQISSFVKESLLLPKGLYTVRKNLGYLWAIFHQATVIWDFDNINEIIVNQTVLPFPLNETLNAWTIPNYMKPLFNPYTCFGTNNIQEFWSRGYPFQSFGVCLFHGYVLFILQRLLQDSSQDDPSCQLSPIAWPTKKLAIIHSLIEGYSGAGLGYEFRKPKLPLHLKTSSNDSSKHDLFIVPRHAFSPYDQQTTFHLRSALWALYLPVTIEQQAADSFRSYVMQVSTGFFNHSR